MEPRAKHIPELDGLRAVCALAVIAFHCRQPWARAGAEGVDVFFVLSGRLITQLLLNEWERSGRIEVAGFLRQRLRRIGPALASLAVAVVAVWPWAWADGFGALTFTENLFRGVHPGRSPLLHTWSLAAEMQCYLVWPLALPWLLAMRRASAARVLLALWAAMTLLRALAVWGSGDADLGYYLPLFRSSGFLLGACTALSGSHSRWGLLAFAGLLAMLALGEGTGQLGQFVVVEPAVEILAAVVMIDPPRLLARGPLPALGAISYGLYLWHYPLCFLFPDRPFWIIAPASIFLAAISWRFIETPFLRAAGAPAARIGGGQVLQLGGEFGARF